MNEKLFGGNEKVITMELERNIRSIANNVHTSNPSSNKSTSQLNPNQGIATLLVMLAVLTIIILFCCFSAPGIRSLCKRYVFRSCTYDDPDIDNVYTRGYYSQTDLSDVITIRPKKDQVKSATPECATPTVILLPYGRMLVVDRNVFSQLHADQSGIDLLELSANLIRSQNTLRQITGSTPSILDSENTSKGLSPTSLGFGPPAYEDIFALRDLDLPPSYSEVSLMLKNQRNTPGECLEMGEISRNWVSDSGIEVREENSERTILEESSDVVCIDVNNVDNEEEVRDSEDTV